MNVGTKSVLYGAHAFWLHPFFVFAAWWKLYGFPWDPRLWVAFFFHDLGYWGKPNMDGSEGEQHPFLGARIMSGLFDFPRRDRALYREGERGSGKLRHLGDWGRFVLYHSRFFAKKHGSKPSRLCIADKLALTLEPWWLYLPRVIASGEVEEYMEMARAAERGEGRHAGEPHSAASRRAWFDAMTTYLRDWVEEHKDGREDTWTPDQREARDESGVWS